MGISHKDREAGEILDINDNYDDIDQADPETGEALEDNIVEDTPLLINIKGCGYPPEVNCDEYADKYYNHSLVGGGVGKCAVIMLQLYRLARLFLVIIQG